MAQLLRGIDDELYVEYGQFALDGTDLAWESPEGYHFMAGVRLESWDGEPALPDTSWTPVKTETFVATEGVVHIATMMDGRGHDFLIGPPFFEYGVAMYFQMCERDESDEDGCDEKWLLRVWPIRDVFDPLVHAVPFQYIVPGVKGHPIEVPPEQIALKPAAHEVPVPVSAIGDWVSLTLDGDRPTFEGRMFRLREQLSRKGITVYDWLRARGIDIEDGAELTPESCSPPGSRPGVFRDPLVDRYYAGMRRERERIPQHFLAMELHEQEEWLRERADGERIAEELSRGESLPFSMPVEGRGVEYLSAGTTRRMWRWEDDFLGGESRDGGLTVDRRIHAKDLLTRQVFVSGIVTILRREEDRSVYGGVMRYVVRDAEPHEAARVLCAEATWEEDPARRRALDELAREKVAEMWAARGR
ncbi:hypothetical protein [Nonomuraea sp. NPDC049784]|uniref:hypothetical protein n=1 Tax=Nonomuraea sp. NPDC049784 TaxID=3154361 RepID=UPI0033E63482